MGLEAEVGVVLKGGDDMKTYGKRHKDAKHELHDICTWRAGDGKRVKDTSQDTMLVHVGLNHLLRLCKQAPIIITTVLPNPRLKCCVPKRKRSHNATLNMPSKTPGQVKNTNLQVFQITAGR